MWGDEMQLQITSNMQHVKINVLKVAPNGEGIIHTFKPDTRLVIKAEEAGKNK